MTPIDYLIIFGLLCFAMLGGWISRMCGGGWPKLPYGLDQWLYAVPHGIVGYLATEKYGWWAVLGCLGAYFCAFLFKRTGHGQYFDLGTTTKLLVKASGKLNVERVDFIVSWLMGPDPNTVREGPGSFRRDYLGMCVTGILLSLGTSIALFTGAYWQLALIVLSAGATKGLWYYIGTFLEKANIRAFGLVRYNEWGEAQFGYWDYWAVGFAIAILMGW